MPVATFDDQVRALLPPSLRVERHGSDGEIAVLRLARSARCTALDARTVLGLESFFSMLSAEVPGRWWATTTGGSMAVTHPLRPA